LPVDVVLLQVGEFGDAEAGVEQRPHDQFFPAGAKGGSALEGFREILEILEILESHSGRGAVVRDGEPKTRSRPRSGPSA
jgi:hypothetical protein